MISWGETIFGAILILFFVYGIVDGIKMYSQKKYIIKKYYEKLKAEELEALNE